MKVEQGSIMTINIEGFEPAEIMELIGTLASYGSPRDKGCILFGVGNDEYLDLLKKKYLEQRFKSGISDEKFVEGPFAMGKTHFVIQFSEIARKMDCVTVFVPLTKEVNVSNSIFVYKQIAQEICPPGSYSKKGIKNLLIACLEKIQEGCKQQSSTPEMAQELVRNIIDSIDDQDFKSDIFARVVKSAFDAYIKRDTERFDAAVSWIRGDFGNKQNGKILNVSPVPKQEQNIMASRVLLSLCQLVKYSGFTGTVIIYDECEQGLHIGPKKEAKLQSLMLSEINSIINLQKGSVLIMYAITSNFRRDLMNLPPFQQRIIHTRGPFSKDNVMSPLIEIQQFPPGSTKKEFLVKIGEKLVDLVYLVAEKQGKSLVHPKESMYSLITKLAEREYNEADYKRRMVKGTCSILTQLYDTGEMPSLEKIVTSLPIPEIDDEV